jgi:DNA polymerase-3 subunit chi
MTRVEFIFNVEDKLAKAADLCEKAVTKGRQLTIVCPDQTLCAHLQQQLWQHTPTSFLPSLATNQEAAKFSPIHFHVQAGTLIQDDILINFDEETPLFFSRFKVLVELVGGDEQDKVAARKRFKFYRDRGYEIKSTNMAES